MEDSKTYQQNQPPYTEFFSWGSDEFGQLALANSDEEGQRQQYYRKAQSFEEPKSLSFDILISSISCGDFHAAFISGDGFVFSVGRNSEGQLGVGDPNLMMSSAPLLVESLQQDQSSYPVVLACGGAHTAVVMSNGDLYTWGQGHYGALGTCSQQTLFAPELVNHEHAQLPRFETVSCGKKHSMAIDQEGSVFVTGDNQFRQLGIPQIDKLLEFQVLTNLTFRAKAVSAGIEHSMILADDDRIYAVGNNYSGNLGLGHTYSSDSFLQVHGFQDEKFKQIVAGRHSAAITEEGKLFVWGCVFKNDNPLLLPQELRSNKMILKCAVGEKLSAIVDEDHHLYTWGLDNDSGQLGRGDQGDQESSTMPQLVDSLSFKMVNQVSVGLDFAIALGQDFDENGNSINQMIDESRISGTQSKFIGRDSQYNNSQSEYNLIQPAIVNKSSAGQVQNPQKDASLSNYDNYQGSRGALSSNSGYQSAAPKEPYPYLQNGDQPLNQASSQKACVAKEQPYAYQPPASRGTEEPSLSFQQQQLPTRASPVDSYKPPVTSEPKAYTSNPNVELYKQLDQLREENFQVKQKQREILHSNKVLKQENEQVMQQAEDEIKRMSDFVETLSQELEQSKRDIEKDFDDKLMAERKTSEDMKLRLQKQQNEIDSQLDKLQREIELLRQEKLMQQQERGDMMSKNKALIEQLEQANSRILQLQRAQLYEPKTNPSPLNTQKNIENLGYQTQSAENKYLQKTPQGSSMQKPPIQSSEKTPQMKYTREMPSYQRETPSGSNQRPRLQEEDSVAEQIRYQPSSSAHSRDQSSFIGSKADYSPYQRVVRDSPGNDNIAKGNPDRYSAIMSPNTREQQNSSHFDRSKQGGDQSYVTQPAQFDSNDKQYHERTNYSDYKPQSRQETQYLAQERSSQYSQGGGKKDQSQLLQEAYGIQKKIVQQQSQIDTYSTISQQKQVSRQSAKPQGENPALGDVKNRLMTMQRNKEELEEKLKNYEAKIRQHFNR